MLLQALFATATRRSHRRRSPRGGAYAAIEPGRPVGGTYYLYRTLRNLDLDGALARLVAEARGGGRLVA